MITVYVIVVVLALLVAGGAYLLQVHRPSGAKGMRGVLSRFLTWLRGHLERLLHRGDESPSYFPPPGGAGPPAPAPQRPAGPVRPAPADPGAPIPLDVTPAEIPPAYGPLLAFIAGFEATEDGDLMMFTRGMAAGDLATADALNHQLEHCLAEIGLDPVSVQGLADYAEQRAEHAQGAMQIWQRFATVYREVQDFVASGGVMPKDGRFFTGEA